MRGDEYLNQFNTAFGKTVREIITEKAINAIDQAGADVVDCQYRFHKNGGGAGIDRHAFTFWCQSGDEAHYIGAVTSHHHVTGCQLIGEIITNHGIEVIDLPDSKIGQ